MKRFKFGIGIYVGEHELEDFAPNAVDFRDIMALEIGEQVVDYDGDTWERVE